MIIRKGRLRWLGNEDGMPEERNVTNEFNTIQEGKVSFGKPRKKWLCDDESDLKKMCIRS